MENWLAIGTGIFLLLMILYGHHKGFIRLAVSLIALMLSLAVVKVAMPEVTRLIREKTPVYELLQDNIQKGLGLEKMTGQTEPVLGEETEAQEPQQESNGEPKTEDSTGLEDQGDQEYPEVLDGILGDLPMDLPSTQRMLIENLKLPGQLKEALMENNNSEVYQVLGVNDFKEYLSNYLASLVLNIIGFIILFILVYGGVRIIMSALDVIAKLPILSGINKLAGAILGGVAGVLLLWTAGLVISIFDHTAWGTEVVTQIEASQILSYLYHNNLVGVIVIETIKNIL